MTEQEILARYSTPGLRKHELSRSEKKAHLESLRITGEAAERILTRLYPINTGGRHGTQDED
jgi:hypothetical protein